MKPRAPLGASRPLVPVIGRGGGRRRRRGPLALLWRRLRPAPAVRPLRSSSRPLHLHPHWTLNLAFHWSLFAAPAGRRAPDPVAARAQQRRPPRGEDDLERRSLMRLLFRQVPAARIPAGAAPLAPSRRLRRAASIPIPSRDDGRNIGSGLGGAPGRPGDGPLPAGRGRPDRRPELAGPGRFRPAWASLLRPAPPRAAATRPAAVRPARAATGSAALRPAGRRFSAAPADRPRRLDELVAAASVPKAAYRPRGFAAPPPTRRQRAVPATDSPAPDPALWQRPTPLAVRRAPRRSAGIAAAPEARAETPARGTRTSGPGRSAEPATAERPPREPARNSVSSRATPARGGQAAVPTIVRPLRPAAAVIPTAAPPGRQGRRAVVGALRSIARNFAGGPAAPVHGLRGAPGIGGSPAVGAKATAMTGTSVQPPRRRLPGGPSQHPRLRPADAAFRLEPPASAAGLQPVLGTARQRVARGLADPGSSPAIGAEATMTGMPGRPPLRRAAGLASARLMPRPADIRLCLPHGSRASGPRSALGAAGRGAVWGLAGAVAGAPQPAARRLTAAAGERARRPRPTIEGAIARARGTVRRAGKASAPAAPVGRAGSAFALPATAPARKPHRPAARPSRPALDPVTASPPLQLTRRPAHRAASRFGSLPPSLDAPPIAFAAAARRRLSPALPAARRRRGDGAAGPGPMRPGPAAKAAMGFPLAPRPIFETIVMTGPPMRRRRVIGAPSRLAAPAAAAGPAPAGRRRRPMRPAASPLASAARPARRPVPAPPVPVERTLRSVAGRSLRPTAADPAAAAAGRTARRPAELLWGKPPASASPLIIGKGEPSPAAAGRAQESVVQASPPVLVQPPSAPDMNRLVDEVVRRLERQARTERLRRGL